MSESAATPAPAAAQRPASQLLTAGILGLLGILAIFVAILYIAGSANSIHALSGGANHGIHPIRLAISLVVGIALLATAGYLARSPESS